MRSCLLFFLILICPAFSRAQVYAPAELSPSAEPGSLLPPLLPTGLGPLKPARYLPDLQLALCHQARLDAGRDTVSLAWLGSALIFEALGVVLWQQTEPYSKSLSVALTGAGLAGVNLLAWTWDFGVPAHRLRGISDASERAAYTDCYKAAATKQRAEAAGIGTLFLPGFVYWSFHPPQITVSH